MDRSSIRLDIHRRHLCKMFKSHALKFWRRWNLNNGRWAQEVMFGSCAFRVPLSLQLVVPGYELDCVSAALVKRILLRYVFDSQFDPGWSPPDHSDAFLCNRIRPQITVVLLLMGFHFIHFFSTPSTIGTDILSIRSSICALSCSSTSGEMNRWLSSRS